MKNSLIPISCLLLMISCNTISQKKIDSISYPETKKVVQQTIILAQKLKTLIGGLKMIEVKKLLYGLKPKTKLLLDT